MQSGIIVQHGHIPFRKTKAVRCDITGVVGFIRRSKWPEGHKKGDFIEIVIRHERDFFANEYANCFDEASKHAVRQYFVNGGILAHVFGVCIEDDADLSAPIEFSFGPQGLQFAHHDHWLNVLFNRLRVEEDIGIICIPMAAYLPFEVYPNGEVYCDAEALYSFFLAHCREMNNRFLLLDSPKGLHDDLLVRWVEQFRRRNQQTASYGALYYPWLCDRDKSYPPSGSIAGIFVRVERDHPPIGIEWPPANVLVHGATHMEIEFEWDEASLFSDNQINPIIVQNGRGIVVFGARTLSNKAQMRFINSRRVLSMIKEQIRRDSAWAVFETHNPHLWSVLDRDIRLRLKEFWDAGLLTRSKNGQQFEVTCNASNNPQYLRDAGQVNVEIKLQPVGCMEQISIDLNMGAGD